MVRRFASSACGFILEMILKGLPKCVIDTVASIASSTTKSTDLLPRSCNVETLDPPERPTPAGCHYR
jgi:hypothetical protein